MLLGIVDTKLHSCLFRMGKVTSTHQLNYIGDLT